MTDSERAAIKDALYAKGAPEDELARLEPLVIEMADAVVALVPGLTWVWNRKVDRIPCEAIPGDPGSASALTLRNLVFEGPIPESAWPEALARMQDIAARVGATEMLVRVDRPGHHDVLLRGSDNVEFGVVTAVAAVITAQTGCYLRLTDLDEYTK